METTNSKSWYLSKTIWGSLVAVAVGTLGAFGVIGAAAEEAAITDIIMQIVGVVGAVIALWGRIVARKNIVPFLLVGLMLCIAGCAGQAARENMLCPAIQDAWQSVRTDAEPVEPMDEATVDCQCPELSMAWSITVVEPTGDPFYKAEKVETVKQLDEMITLMCKE